MIALLSEFQTAGRGSSIFLGSVPFVLTRTNGHGGCWKEHYFSVTRSCATTKSDLPRPSSILPGWLPSFQIVTKVQLPNLYLRNLDITRFRPNVEEGVLCPHPPQGAVKRSLTSAARLSVASSQLPVRRYRLASTFLLSGVAGVRFVWKVTSAAVAYRARAGFPKSRVWKTLAISQMFLIL